MHYCTSASTLVIFLLLGLISFRLPLAVMVSIMNDFKVENESASSTTSNTDLSFIGMESLQEGARFSEGGYLGSAHEHRVSSVLDMAQKLPDLEARVSGNVAEGGYGSLAVETKMDMDVGVNDLVSLVEENRIPFLQSGGWMHGFRTGDMVWGKVKSHPWWPGHIFNEAFASLLCEEQKGRPCPGSFFSATAAMDGLILQSSSL
ncbi:hypothetical protein HPP92_026264 [Vanilla planifolia]|uniref:PWWP domain-containing protein n=1 Tax=Vanilla planifolia TaxID=51239 RepID=A0A835PG87_VANPL|nr:hypothetical protein HPP92_026264 [Vanilla planifolia]